MQLKKIFSVTAAVLMLTTSCLDDKGSYQAGFARLGLKHSAVYANTLSDSLYVASYGSWRILPMNSSSWCQVQLTNGGAYTNYDIGITVEENTTGATREAIYRIEDTNHPDDGYQQWRLVQYAIRGDGSLGNAAMVSAITGSDGSSWAFTYDRLHRPLTLTMKKGEAVVTSLKFAYNDYSGGLTVQGSKGELKASYETDDYQPGNIIGTTDSVLFVEQFVTRDWYAFNIEEHETGGKLSAYAYKVATASMNPDSLHNADSLIYVKREGTQNISEEHLKLVYSPLDNRCQSVDVNQLLLGADHCNPYMLLSLYRPARNSNILSQALSSSVADNISVSAELNSNKSVKTLTVSRAATNVTYTFEYTE
jgi:hypothetical protein